jgi:hypothetical protein
MISIATEPYLCHTEQSHLAVVTQVVKPTLSQQAAAL